MRGAWGWDDTGMDKMATEFVTGRIGMMRGSNYVVIVMGDHGLRVDVMSREEFEKRITPGPRGDRYYGGDREPLRFVRRLEDVKAPGDLMVIAGEVVIPKPVEIVTKYDLGD